MRIKNPFSKEKERKEKGKRGSCIVGLYVLYLSHGVFKAFAFKIGAQLSFYT